MRKSPAQLSRFKVIRVTGTQINTASLNVTIYRVLFFHNINIFYGCQRTAGKVYPQQYQVSPRRTPVCFIFFAFFSSAKLRQFHFCQARPKNPLGTHSPSKGTCERSAGLKAGDTKGFALCHQCWAVNPVNPSESQLQGSPGTAGLAYRGCWGTMRSMAGGQPTFLKGWAHIPLVWESNAALVLLASSPSDLLKCPKNLKKNMLLSWLVFSLSLFLTAVSPIVLLPLTPFSCMEQKPTRLLLGLCLHWQMWDGWCSRRCPGLKWVNLNRFRVWMLLWQMSSTITAISFWKTGLEMSWNMCVGCFTFFSFFSKGQKRINRSVQLPRRSWGNFKNNNFCGVSHLSMPARKREEKYYLWHWLYICRKTPTCKPENSKEVEIPTL